MTPNTYNRIAFWYMTAYVATTAAILCAMLAGCATPPQQATTPAPEQDFAFDSDFLDADDETRPWGAYAPVAPWYHMMSGRLTATDGTRWYLLVTEEVCGEESWSTADDKRVFYRDNTTCTNQVERPVFTAKVGREDQ